MKLIDHVRGMSTFDCFTGNTLWYKTDTGFNFPIPVSDTKGGTFIHTDKSIFFMRWIRPHYESIQQAMEEANNKHGRESIKQSHRAEGNNWID